MIKKNTNGKIVKINSNQRGSAMIIVVIIAFITLLVMTMTVTHSISALVSQDNVQSIIKDKWNARSSMAVLSQIIRLRTPVQFQNDYRLALSCTVNKTIPVFDTKSVEISIPVVKYSPAGDISCSTGGSANPTSLLGNLNNWAAKRQILYLKEAESKFNLPAQEVNIASFKESARRYLNGKESGYVLNFLLDSKNNNFRSRNDGEILLNVDNLTCGTFATTSISPTNINKGQMTVITFKYSAANKIRLLNSSRTVIRELNIPETLNVNTVAMAFFPPATDSYFAEVEGSGGCLVSTTPEVVTVKEPPPPCPAIAAFSGPSTVTSGNPATISWNATDAVRVTLNGVDVSASGTQTYNLSATTKFVLVAYSQTGTCNTTQEITVNVSPPACTFTAPTISSLAASPALVTPGSNSVISFNISGLNAANAYLSGPNGYSQGGIGNGNGNLSVYPPPSDGNYNYTLTALNTCPDGSQLTTQQNVNVTVKSCPPPSIGAFTVDKTTVTQGQSAAITFSWNIGGSVDAVSIDNGIGGGFGASGNVLISQPQTTTTYTLTAVGCGITRQAQVTVTVNPPPMPVLSCTNVITSGGSPGEPTSGNRLFYDYGPENPSNGRMSFYTTNSGGNISVQFDFFRDWTTRWDPNGGVMGQDCDYTDYLYRLNKIEFYDVYNNLIITSDSLGDPRWTTNYNFYSPRPLGYFVAYQGVEMFNYINDGTGGCYQSGNTTSAGTESICFVR